MTKEMKRFMATLPYREAYKLGFDAGRKQGMKDAAAIAYEKSAGQRDRRIKHATLEAMEKLP